MARIMAKAKEPGRKIVAQNKKARHDYNILDEIECGLVLTGTEVKSLRAGRASLVDGFAEITGGEAWLHNVHIMEYAQGTWTNHAARRKRKLLLHKQQILKIHQKVKEGGYTIVPLRLFFNEKGRAKIDIALGKGKKLHDKRETEKKRSWERERGRLMRAKG